MLQLHTILLPTDFSACAEAALPYALDLARRHDADLHVLHVTPVFGEDPVKGAFQAMVDESAFYRRLRDEADNHMQRLLSAYDTQGVPIKRVHTNGAAPGDVINEYAAAEDADLIVMGTHGRRGLSRMLLGSVARDVALQATCPVLTVPCTGVQSTDLTRIVVPVDFSVYSINALAYGRQLAGLFGADLDVLHVIDPVMNEQLHQLGWTQREDAERDLEAKALQRLTWLSGEVRGPAPVKLTPHVATGYPPGCIVEFAQAHKADLVIIASHGLSGRERFPMGGVTERVIRTASCPVFITRPFGKSLLPHPRELARKGQQETAAL